MKLTETAIRNAKPSEKSQKLSDGDGLHLEVTPKGGKWWRFRYQFDRKEKLISLGTYPEVSLKQARERRETARKQVADGIDPSEFRKAHQAARLDRAANSFEAVAREWYAKMAPTWAENHGPRILRRLEVDLFPWIGDKPIAEVTAPQILACLRRIESRGANETAHRALQNCGQVMRYAVATGRAEGDPTSALRGALVPVTKKHFAAVTEPKEAAELLRTLDSYAGSFTVKSALRLAPLVFVRPGELGQALWADVDLEAGEWRYLVTKTKTDHIVPLATQAVEILKELKPLTGQSRYVFPSATTEVRCMSNNAILAAMRRMGIDTTIMTGHGFRAMARTILDEVLHVPVPLIEHQLAHAVRDANGTAYNRTKHLPERRKMMQQWADYLDQIKLCGSVVPFVRRSS